jgi:hypothetical protein
MDTLLTLILPPGTTEVTATLIAKRGDYAHMDRFSYTETNLLTAIQVAMTELDSLERIPPHIEIPSQAETHLPVNKPAVSQTPKPKKKKVSLADFPEDAPVEGHIVPVQPVSPNLQIGMEVSIGQELLDVDGEAVPFQIGRVLEIDTTTPTWVWLESLDGQHDVWVWLTDLM